MRDGVQALLSVYAPKDTSRTYPILLSRTPYSCRPYGSQNVRDALGPSEPAARERFIFVYQDVRGRFMSEGEFVNVRPHQPDEAGPPGRGREHRHLGHDRLAGEARAEQQRQGRHVGHLVPGLLRRAGMIDAHPALKAVSPQAPIADWFIGDDFHHNGAFFLPHAFNFYSPLRPCRGPSPPRRASTAFDYGTAGRLSLLPGGGAAREPGHRST